MVWLIVSGALFMIGLGGKYICDHYRWKRYIICGKGLWISRKKKVIWINHLPHWYQENCYG